MVLTYDLLSSLFGTVAHAEEAPILLDVSGAEVDQVILGGDPYWCSGTVSGNGEELILDMTGIGFSASWTNQALLKNIAVEGGKTYRYSAVILSDRDRQITVLVNGNVYRVQLTGGEEYLFEAVFETQTDTQAVQISYEVGYDPSVESTGAGQGNLILIRHPGEQRESFLDLSQAIISSEIWSYDPFWTNGVVSGTGNDFTMDMGCIGGSTPWANQGIITIPVREEQNYLYSVYVTADTDRAITVWVNGVSDIITLEANVPYHFEKEIQVATGVNSVTIKYAVGYDPANETVGAWAGSVIRVTDYEPDMQNPEETEKEPGEETENAILDVKISAENQKVILQWDSIANADTYQILRATGRYSNFTPVAELSAESIEYVDSPERSVYDYYYKVLCTLTDGEVIESEVKSMDIELFGEGVNIFSPTDDVEQLNSILKNISDKMLPADTAEFSEDRYAILFKPGDYSTINTIQVGFYTQISGLGKTPYEVKIPNINVDASTNGNALVNFWRSVENLAIDTGNSETEVKWAASQAAPLRRLYVNGKLHLDDIGKEASGGFLADSFITGQTGSWSQQQYFVRNSVLTNGWYNGVWNILFVGTENAPATTENWGSATYNSHTNVAVTDVIREKPFLYLDDEGTYQVFVPALRENALGISWSENSMGDGYSLPVEAFYIAKPDVDTADTINHALSEGKNLILTPGIYEVDKPIEVTNANTVVLGLGMATIRVKNTASGMIVADEDGITIAGVLFDAGEQGSETLLQVGDGESKKEHSLNPILLSDIFTRVGGGQEAGKTGKSVEINSNNVIGDHFWLWRADHGKDVAWTTNTGKNGLVVNGDDVTIYGLFVEHFQEYQTLWNGEGGATYFYQSELPYDVPYQTDWMSHDGTVNGYASLKVADEVQRHKAVALGVYSVFTLTSEYIQLDHAIEVSNGSEILNACIVALGGNGGINNIVNEAGGGVSSRNTMEQPSLTKVGLNYYVREEPNEPEPIANPEEEQPEIAPKTSLKKGVCSWYYASEEESRQNIPALGKLGVSWFYNWNSILDTAVKARNAGLEYVPMLWGGASVNEDALRELRQGVEEGLYHEILTFNEPDLGIQANMSVEDALDAYGKILSALDGQDVRIGSPAGAAAESAWLEAFMNGATERGYRVDFIAIHVYQDPTHPESVRSLEEALQRLHDKYDKPIWITEIGSTDVSGSWNWPLYGTLDHNSSVQYMAELMTMLEANEYVERYAWFVDYSSDLSGTEYTRLFDVENGTLTAEGRFYASVGTDETPGVASDEPSEDRKEVIDGEPASIETPPTEEGFEKIEQPQKTEQTIKGGNTLAVLCRQVTVAIVKGICTLLKMLFK